MKNEFRKGFYFKQYEAPFQSPFDRLFEVFKELITHTSGDFDEAIDWLRELDKEYKLTDSNYTIDDFIEDLKKKGYIQEEFKEDGSSGGIGITAKTERAIRQQALDQIFGNLKKATGGNHKTKQTGTGDEHTGEFREFNFGDGLERISLTESLRNAQINNGVEEFMPY
jgi:Ca-activated chloride channel family protein